MGYRESSAPMTPRLALRFPIPYSRFPAQKNTGSRYAPNTSPLPRESRTACNTRVRSRGCDGIMFSSVAAAAAQLSESRFDQRGVSRVREASRVGRAAHRRCPRRSLSSGIVSSGSSVTNSLTPTIDAPMLFDLPLLTRRRLRDLALKPARLESAHDAANLHRSARRAPRLPLQAAVNASI